MTDEQIKHMVDRFLSWKLPENFNPDAGISFKPTFNEHTAHEGRHQPSGTNLFDAGQADTMVRHMAEGLPDARAEIDRLRQAVSGAAAQLAVMRNVRQTAFLKGAIGAALQALESVL